MSWVVMDYLNNHNSTKFLAIMPYLKYERVEYIEMANWWSVKTFVKVINRLRAMNYTIQESRNQMLESLNQMPNDAPFAIDERFPSTGLFVCEMTDTWMRQLQQIRSSLMVKDRRTERHESTVSAKTTGVNDSTSDAQQAFFNATTGALESITQREGVFNRAAFESHFRLVWVDDEVVHAVKKAAAESTSDSPFTKAVVETIVRGSAVNAPTTPTQENFSAMSDALYRNFLVTPPSTSFEKRADGAEGPEEDDDKM